jgi:hypothetical protein
LAELHKTAMAMTVQYAKANFCSINVRNQTKKAAKLSRHLTKSFDSGSFIFDTIDNNFESNDGLADDLYNEIRMLG